MPPQNHFVIFFSFLVSYTLLVQFSLQKAHDSIRKAIAGISGISPLRISHLYVSSRVNSRWEFQFPHSSYSAHCKNLMKIFQSQKTRQMKWAWNCSVLLVILAKMQIFKANFQPDGGILQKSLFFKSFEKMFKNFLRVKT